MGCNPENMKVNKSPIDKYFEQWLKKNYTNKDTLTTRVLFTKDDLLEAYAQGFILCECMGVKVGRRKA